jgi:undecaprenyl-diphosphatase
MFVPSASLSQRFRWISNVLKRTSLIERAMLVVMVLLASALWAFAEVADAMMEGEIHEFDRRLLLAFRNPNDLADPLGPAWLEEIMRDFTALGGTAVLTCLTLGVAGYLLLARKRRVALMVVLSVGGGLALSHFLKWGFDRPRPDLVAHFSQVYTQSFPSGHSMLSAVVYLTLGALLARMRTEIRLKIYLLSLALFATVLVGVSRVYLGVHWPSDVMAGWSIGASWALVWWLVMLWTQARGHVDAEGDPLPVKKV